MWQVEFIPSAKEDLQKLDGSVRHQVEIGIYKVSQNPVPKKDGGYGEPLGHIRNNNLTGLYKIKFKRIGIRVIYKLIKIDDIMKIVVVLARADNYCYNEANKRK
jgi:mRNA interferase RelE/StbE